MLKDFVTSLKETESARERFKTAYIPLSDAWWCENCQGVYQRKTGECPNCNAVHGIRLHALINRKEKNENCRRNS